MRLGGWNCRSMGNGLAVRGFLALQKEDPDVLFLSETKLDKKGIEKLKYKLGMPHVVFKECEGRSGGLAMFWKRGINLSLRCLGRMHIDVEITENDGFKWSVTGIYGEPRTEKREETWKLLRNLHMQVKMPWVCIDDFNEILYSFEKQGGNPKPQIQMERFRNALNFCNLNDLGFEGDIFTWRNNNYRVDGYIRERLDRVVANPEWCARFPNYKVVNGCPEHSDHRPVLLSVDGPSRRQRPRPNSLNKRFEARWILEEDCEQVVQSAWKEATDRGASNTMDLISSVSKDLPNWSRDVLGDLQQRIKKLRKELEDIRLGAITDISVQKEQVARFKLERLEDQLDLFWKQRAHAHWLEKGDRNTSYFHAFASERKKKNTIKKLKGEDGVVVEGEEALKNLVTNYFSSLFTPIVGTEMNGVLDSITPRVTDEMNDYLNLEYTEDEVKRALDEMGDLKAPGADGMPAVVYKRFWGTVGETVVKEVLQVLRGGSIPEGWNETIVVLIPKVQNPDRMKDLRPISLCNVVYKLISKVIANRLKRTLIV
jgi:hypothetical protein